MTALPRFCAIGNALVDLEYQVSDKFIAQNGFSKGTMLLLDAQRFQQVLTQLQAQYPMLKKVGGGSAANSAVVCSQLGANSRYLCQLGSDDLGRFYEQDLVNQGVRCFSFKSNQSTGVCLVLVSADGERTLLTYLGASASLSLESVDLGLLEDSEWLFLEGYVVSQEKSFLLAKEAIVTAQKAATKVAMSFSDPSMVQFFAEPIRELLSYSPDLVFANQQEIQLYTAEKDLTKAIHKLHQSTSQLVVTCNKQGSIASVYGEQMVVEPSVKAELLDSNGAGDAFAGALMYGLIEGWSLAKASTLANAVAAKVVSQFGARMKTIDVLAIRDRIRAEAS